MGYKRQDLRTHLRNFFAPKNFLFATTKFATHNNRTTMSSTGTLEAATQDRKARLAALRGLKRKAPEPSQDNSAQPASEPQAKDEDNDVTTAYLSGRNYDAETRGPKLGFETAPDAEKDTLEVRAAALELQHKEDVAKEAAEKDAPIDLFKLQPKKPNWDLKRDLKERTAVLDSRTKNAIARLVRERLEGERQKKIKAGETDAEDGVVPMEGGELVEAMHLRERQEEEERRREKEEDEADIT